MDIKMGVNKKTPIPTTEWEDIEEALGVIWHRFEDGIHEKGPILSLLSEGVTPEVYQNLITKGFVEDKGNTVTLTPEGERLAKDVTRRHRLAERLLADVLGLEPKTIDPNACQLEHILSQEVSESICTLLGHPTECPHGSPIPKGECCTRDEKKAIPVVCPLEHLEPGEDGHIAYLALQHHPELHKLLSLGVIPGSALHIHQTFPTYVIQLGETQLALEREVAKHIFVRRASGDPTTGLPPTLGRERRDSAL